MAMTLPRRPDRIAGINVTPFADVIIVLLIIFIERGRVRALPFAESALPALIVDSRRGLAR